jgi:transposase InsO family protein
MTDNAFAYTQSHSFKKLLWRRAIRHIRTRPYTPRTNGKVERWLRRRPGRQPLTGYGLRPGQPA